MAGTIAGVAFDFDGTLVDSNRIKDETFLQVIEAAGGNVAAMRHILSGEHGDRYDIFRRFAAQSPLPGHTADSLTADYTRRVEEAIAVCPETPGADALLRSMRRRGVRLAIVSATPSAPLVAVVERRGWRRLLDDVIGDAGDKASALARLAARWSLTAEQILLLGDHEVDQRGAREFGCPFIGVCRQESDFRTPPAYAVRDLIEAAPLIEARLALVH